MRRRRTLAALVLTAVLVLSLGTAAALGAAGFTDVPSTHQFYVHINRLADLEIVGGFPDGTYKPDDPVTRQQFAKIIVLATGKHTDATDNQSDPTFSDVTPASGIPYPFDYIEEAAGVGYILGNQGMFNPGNNITRVQLALIVVRAGGGALAEPPAGYSTGFGDVPGYGQAAVAKAKFNGLLDGKTATTFDPYANATRGQVAKMVANLLDMIGDPPPQAYRDADGIAGGSAYSQWWTLDAAGSGTKPTTAVGADFFRCKACHGWDGLGTAGSYANRTGMSTGAATRPDVSAADLRTAAGSESIMGLYDLIRNVGGRGIDEAANAHPDFATILSEAQVWNLVKFIREEWVDPDLLYDLTIDGPPVYTDTTVDPPVVVKPTLTYSNIGALGNEAAGQALYTSTCAACHGADATTIELEGMSVGQFVRTKPNEAWFKVKFGIPGKMPMGLLTETSDLQDIYKALANPANFPDMP
ncbi:MAG: S-layer homology domain-containing protein [Thermoleophilia bacterium]